MGYYGALFPLSSRCLAGRLVRGSHHDLPSGVKGALCRTNASTGRDSRLEGSSGCSGSRIAASIGSPVAAWVCGVRGRTGGATLRLAAIGRRTGKERSVILGELPRQNGTELLVFRAPCARTVVSLAISGDLSDDQARVTARVDRSSPRRLAGARPASSARYSATFAPAAPIASPCAPSRVPSAAAARSRSPLRPGCRASRHRSTAPRSRGAARAAVAPSAGRSRWRGHVGAHRCSHGRDGDRVCSAEELPRRRRYATTHANGPARRGGQELIEPAVVAGAARFRTRSYSGPKSSGSCCDRRLRMSSTARTTTTTMRTTRTQTNDGPLSPSAAIRSASERRPSARAGSVGRG